MREWDRLKIIKAIVQMGLKPGRAAERRHVSVRQIERLVLRYRARPVHAVWPHVEADARVVTDYLKA